MAGVRRKCMIKNKEYFSGIRGIILILGFVIFHEKEYRQRILKSMYLSLPLLGVLLLGVWEFDLQKLSPTGSLSYSAQWGIRWLCTSLLFLLFVAHLAFVTKPYIKKWRNFSGLSSQEMKQFIEYRQKHLKIS
jgi:hypothetical protein